MKADDALKTVHDLTHNRHIKKPWREDRGADKKDAHPEYPGYSPEVYG